MLIEDTGFPRCSHHSDCRDGEYCGISYSNSFLRCDDCNVDIWTEKNYSDSFCADVLEEEENNLGVFTSDHMAWVSDRTETDNLRNNSIYICSAKTQCKQNDLSPDYCDFVHLTELKMSYEQYVALIFVAFFLASVVSKDV